MDYKQRIIEAKAKNRKVAKKALYPKSHESKPKPKNEDLVKIHVAYKPPSYWLRRSNCQFNISDYEELLGGELFDTTEYYRKLCGMGIYGFYDEEAPYSSMTYVLDKKKLAIFSMITSGVEGIKWINDIDVTC